MSPQPTTLPIAPADEIAVHPAEQARLLTEIIHMRVGLEAVPSPTPWPPQEDLVEAVVRFTGPWAGAMIFECTLPLSFEFTARFMAVLPPDAVDEDVRDSIGELANMIAGNFKALLPAGSHLSIPKVCLSHGPQQERTAPRPVQKVLCQSVFHTGFGRCCLTLEAS
jgi:chemotaxis protein CheX